MKIIRNGDLSLLRKIKRFECDKCGCIFEADKSEYKDQSNQKDGLLFSCSCPACHNNCWNYDQ